jgi:hypothetical protein
MESSEIDVYTYNPKSYMCKFKNSSIKRENYPEAQEKDAQRFIREKLDAKMNVYYIGNLKNAIKLIATKEEITDDDKKCLGLKKNTKITKLNSEKDLFILQ